MESFPRPDIAEGIFYEYLRYDNPISPELRDRVVDGFPFLLGPLSQVRGISIGQNTQVKAASQSNTFMATIARVRDTVVSHAVDIAGLAKRTAIDASELAGNAGKVFGDAAIEFAKEADRRRDLMVKHSVAAPSTIMKLVYRDEETIRSISRWMSGEPEEPDIPAEDESLSHPTPKRPRGRVFGYPLSRWFGEDYQSPDEIGPMKIHPTINKIILTLVHLYLLLLFIVSFPGSNSTRTKLTVRKTCSNREIFDDSDSDTSEEYKACFNAESTSEQSGNERLVRSGTNGSRNFFIPRTLYNRTGLPGVATPESGLSLKKKSLSYFL